MKKSERVVSAITIRTENPADVAAISRVIELAFESHPHSEQTEHFIVAALRAADALSVSLVAEKSRQVIGHVAFSQVRFSDAAVNWYGLGPVAVLPEHQRQGVGNALIVHGLAALRELGAGGCVVLGEPQYYSRFGFKNQPECIFEGVPAEYFQTLLFDSRSAAGKVTYHEAFDTKN